MKIDKALIEKVRQIPLSSVVKQYVEIKKKGKEWEGKCPFHNEKSASFFVNDVKGIFHCFGCGQAGDVIHFIQEKRGVSFEQAIELLAEDRVSEMPESDKKFDKPIRPCNQVYTNTPKALEIWNTSNPALGSNLEVYLSSRAITMAMPPTIRFNANLKHNTAYVNLPTMIGAVAKWPERQICGVHRTYLKTDCSAKIPLKNNKMMLGPVAGGAVRLAPIKNELAICEGIETGLSVIQLTGIPTWACLSANGIKNVILPDEIKTVHIFADHDAAGISTGRLKMRELLKANKQVQFHYPINPGDDFNDLLMKGITTWATI